MPCGRAKLYVLENSPAHFSSQIPRTFFKKKLKILVNYQHVKNILTLDTENKNLGIVVKYFLTHLINLNCNFIFTESVRFYTYIFLLQTNNCIKKNHFSLTF